ncbi:CRE-SRH-286 protein [Caenorhabditis remanei]|uniref:CRE-SRH-286 protein n=1 Tax=Caenorhabditis remanei TaxID=31234 RepID=E3MTF0_CAERE|nr:CRE-SRH-286 protein [Caenorhabditis remanei]
MFLASPVFYANSLHVLTVITTPLQILGSYCIIFKTPKSMGTIKWSLLNLHFWCMVLDWALTMFIIPLLILPVLGGCPLGILTTWFGVSTHFQAYIIITLIFMAGTSVVVVFENRYHQLYGSHPHWRYFRIPFLMLNYFLTVSFSIPAFVNMPEQHWALEISYKKLPELPDEIKSLPLFILAVDLFWLLIPLSSMAFLIVTECVVFIVLINRNLKASSKQATLSKTTIKFQKKFLRALYLQASVSCFYFSIPTSYTLFSQFSGIYSQGLIHFVLIIASTHGFSSTLVMIWAHKPYREFCFQIIVWIQGILKIKPSKVVQKMPNNQCSATIFA